jgi:hypothetical protein
MGLLDKDSGAALALLGSGLLGGNFAGGLAAASQYASGIDERKQRGLLAQMQMDNYRSEMEARQLQMAQKQAEAQRQAALRAKLPSLFRQGGMTGGEAVPQTMGGVEMFSKPAGVAPMQATPGGFDARSAALLGMDPDEIQKYAAIDNIGRQEVARTINVPGPNGEKMVMQLDKFGQPVGKPMTEFEAAQFLNLGDRQVAAVPRAGQQFSVGMSPSERDASARGWAGHNLSKQRLAMEQGNMVADSGGPSQVGLVKQFGKPSPGYRWKADGSQEAIPGGPADIKAGEAGAKAQQRQQTAMAQADSVLGEIRDAKNLVGWNTAGLGGAAQFIPATDARNLSAKLQTVKANLGFDRLQQMRDQSPTGGALGQVAVQELASLQATVASLDQMQSPTQLGQALDKIERHYTNWRNVVSQAANPQGGASGGWGIREKK